MTQDTVRLEEWATLLLAKFDTINRRDIPERFDALVDCIRGAIRQQIRLGREIDTLQLRGKIAVDVTVDAVGHAVESL